MTLNYVIKIDFFFIFNKKNLGFMDMGIAISKIICHNGQNWKVGDAVETKYGIGKIIHIRNNHKVPYVVVLSYGLGYFGYGEIEPYVFPN
jgi:hypothetical protein